MDMNLSKLQELVKDREAWYAEICGITKSQTWLSEWTELNEYKEKETDSQTENKLEVASGERKGGKGQDRGGGLISRNYYIYNRQAT